MGAVCPCLLCDCLHFLTFRDDSSTGRGAAQAPDHMGFKNDIRAGTYPGHRPRHEMRTVPVVSFLLRRCGAKFVDRNQGSKSSADARQLIRAAQGGESLGFFPEGTFWREPGIRRFRAGAFLAASKGNLPVVPIAISGTRRMLASGMRMPRRANLLIDILPAITPGDDSIANSRQLAEAARRQIIAATGEPDIE
jgi:1-acyl-sn-glycerol-3-phosphate acyltransferase